MTVLVTRPGVEGQSLCQQLADEGIQAIHHPLIRIVDNPNSADLSTQLNNSDIIIAVSHHAVTAAQNILSKTSSIWPRLIHDRHALGRLGFLFTNQLFGGVGQAQ